MEDEQVVEALPSHTTQEALTDCIGSRGMVGGLEQLNATRLGNPREGHAKLAIVIPDEILRPHTKDRGEASLLGSPRVSGRACHTDVDHFARVQFNDEEGEQRTEEKICDWEKVARPDVLGMSV